VAAASTEHGRRVLRDHRVEVIGFVARDDAGDPRLARFVINCCAADGVAVQLDLDSADELPDDGTWVRLVGSVSETVGHGDDGEVRPRLVVEGRTTIDEPRLPYEVPVTRIR
jgi:uncharacterized membrane protein YcgQ (UPF0703/DUF1980 family)